MSTFLLYKDIPRGLTIISADIPENPRVIFVVYAYMQICECWMIPAFLDGPVYSRDIMRTSIMRCDLWVFLGTFWVGICRWLCRGICKGICRFLDGLREKES